MISVIMSSYNGSQTIDRAIRSILCQTYTNFEFIICDDGSTDNTLDHIIKFAKLDNRIKIITNTHNLGLQKSLNKCLKISSGSFIARMDDDDDSFKNRFYIQLRFLKSHPNISFVGSNVLLSDKDYVYGKKIYPIYPNKFNLFKYNCFAHPSVIIRSSVIKINNGYSESPLFIRAEDYELWLRLYSKGYKGANIQSYLLKYNFNIHNNKSRFTDYINTSKLLYRYKQKLHIGFKGYYYIILPLIKMLIPRFIMNMLYYLKYKN